MSALPPALSRQDYALVLSALADVVLEQHLDTRSIRIDELSALPSPELSEPRLLLRWWLRGLDFAKRRSVRRGLRELAAGAQDSWLDEYELTVGGGLRRHVIHRAILLRDEQQRPARIAHVIQDVTDRHLADERQLAEREELERHVQERTRVIAAKNAELARAMRHKDEFLASMSHELRTPLNAVLGLTDAMLEGVAGPASDRHRSWLGDIKSSGAHLLGLINDLLDLARIESGQLEIDLQPTSPSDLAEATLRLVHGAALAKGIKLERSIPAELPALVTDARLLRQILLNLLGNAVKFTPRDGQVHFRVRAGVAPDTVEFEVADTGIGIPPDRLADIFQPFVQVDAGLDRQAGGTGLGLALVSRMADRLGGSVAVESNLGIGSTFVVVLPSQGSETRDSGEFVLEVAELPSVAAPRPPRVLLAEDNEANVRTFRDYLTAKGMEVLVVSNGLEAVEKARDLLPDVVLMDVQMPVMDGLQATRILRGSARTKHIPVIALTALAMPGDRERCFDAGADAYMSKPVRLRELAAEIRRLSFNAAVALGSIEHPEAAAAR